MLGFSKCLLLLKTKHAIMVYLSEAYFILHNYITRICSDTSINLLETNIVFILTTLYSNFITLFVTNLLSIIIIELVLIGYCIFFPLAKSEISTLNRYFI